MRAGLQPDRHMQEQPRASFSCKETETPSVPSARQCLRAGALSRLSLAAALLCYATDCCSQAACLGMVPITVLVDKTWLPVKH